MSQGLPSSLRLRVISPHELLVDEEVEEVSLPSLEGYVGILPGHRPLFLAVGRGRLGFRRGGKEKTLAVQGGYAEILPEQVLVLTELAKDEEEPSAAG